MMKLSDYVALKLVAEGIQQVFMVTGGGAMHLNNSIGKHPDLKVLFNHHEQASAMAAEGYARVSRTPALVSVTTGPGGTNAITGVLGAWHDSLPMLVISGQVRYDTTVRSTGMKLRQLGDQELDIIRMSESITKYAVMVTEPTSIRYHLERALYLAKAGRPGPCWLDIPMNVQAAMIEPETLMGYDPSEDSSQLPPRVGKDTVTAVLQSISEAKRPVIMAGTAIRMSGAHASFMRLVDKLNMPVVTAFNAHDVIEDDHPLYCGRPGTVGDRPGNFVVQNSDLLIVLGCRLNIRQVSYNWTSFAREAYKIIVDIDPLELRKPTIKADLPVHADVADFVAALLEAIPEDEIAPRNEWLSWCQERKLRYPVTLPEYWQRQELVNSYCFVEALGNHLMEGQITVTSNAAACVCTFQAIRVKRNQLLFSNSGCASMGYDLPASIGACLGGGGVKTVCLAGDGSIQMNIQELQTIIHNHLPIKIFIFNNFGYHSIRQTQENFFGRPLVGCEASSGVSFPDMEKIAFAYGIPFVRCANHGSMDAAIAQTLDVAGPAICEVMMTPEQPFAPKTSSFRLPDGRIVSRPLEDLAPFLERVEFLENMIINPIPE